MTSYIRKTWLSRGLAMVFLAGTLVAQDKPTRSLEDLTALFKDEVVAQGKGFKVLRSELDKAVILTKANRAALNDPIPSFLTPKVEAQLLDKLVTTKLLLLQATDADRKEGQSRAEGFIGRYRAQAGSDAAFERQVLATGMEIEVFQHQVIEQAVIKAVIDRLIKGDYLVPDEQIRRKYAEQRERFTSPERAEIRNIFFATRDVVTGDLLSAADRSAKKELAAKVRQEAVAGADFEALVAQYSEDRITKDRGGQLTIARGEAGPELESAVFSLSEGEVSEVIETATGLHLLKLEKKMARSTSPLEEVRDIIRIELETEFVQTRLPAYLEQLRKEAEVEILFKP